MIVPTSVTSIGDCFVMDCCYLKKIVIPSNTQIDKFIFKDFTMLTEFKIPSTVKTIYKHAFSNCKSLTKIEIPSSVIKIGEFAFYHCSSLKEIILPPSLISIECSTFSGCSSLETINIPSSVKSIGLNAFSDCKSLTNVTIPSSVKSIGFTAFESCPLLTEITVDNYINNIEIFVTLPDTPKLVIVGETEVGKSCIMKRLTLDMFPGISNPTIGAEFFLKSLTVDDKILRFHIWDTASHEAYRAPNKVFFKDLNGAVIVFDLTHPKTLDDARRFIDEVREYSGQIPLILLGNKFDIGNRINDIDMKTFENNYNIKYFEVSAKSGYNIKEAFQYLFDEIINNLMGEKYRLLKLMNGKKCNIC